jgi:hypothetical protein
VQNGRLIGSQTKRNEEEQFYLVRDIEKNFTEWVPMADVTSLWFE